MSNYQKQQIANEWKEFAISNFYCPWSPEDHDYAPIFPPSWDYFGDVMATLTEGLEDPMPNGTEDRLYYRVFAAIRTGGIRYAKEMNFPEYVISSFMEAVDLRLKQSEDLKEF